MRSLASWPLGLGVVVIAASAASGSGCSAKKVTEIVPGATTQIQVPADIAAIRVDIKSNGALVTCTQYTADNGTLVLPATIGIIPKNDGAAGTTTITVEVRAYDTAGVQSSVGDLFGCTQTPVGAPGGPRVLRRSIQSFVDQRELFLPMPLSYSCFNTDCSADSDPSDTCKGAQCVTSTVDPTALHDFNPQLVDGTGICFDPALCFGDAVSAVAVDPAHCLFEVPEYDAALERRQRARLLPDGRVGLQARPRPRSSSSSKPSSEQEILNVDATEGFTIPDASKPQQFQLAPGLCALYTRATTPPPPPTTGTTTVDYLTPARRAGRERVRAQVGPLAHLREGPEHRVHHGRRRRPSTRRTCRVPGAPLTLEAGAEAPLYLVMDALEGDGRRVRAAGVRDGDEPVADEPRLQAARSWASRFLDHCMGGFAPHAGREASASAAAVQPSISAKLLTPNPPDPTCDPTTSPATCAPIDLVAATDLTLGTYAEAAKFASGLGEPLNVGAVMFFVNRAPVPVGMGAGDAGATDAGAVACPGQQVFSGLECSSVASEATALANAAKTALSTDGLQTYYVVLSNDLASMPGGDATPNSLLPDEVNAKLAGQPNMVIDATQPVAQAQNALANFASVATSLGTCVYELPPGVDKSAQMSFTIPVPAPPITTSAPATVPVPFNASCNAATQSADGGAPDGWNIDGPHIRVCGASCQRLQASVEAVTAASLADAGASATSAASTPEVAVTVTMGCADN